MPVERTSNISSHEMLEIDCLSELCMPMNRESHSHEFCAHFKSGWRCRESFRRLRKYQEETSSG